MRIGRRAWRWVVVGGLIGVAWACDDESGTGPRGGDVADAAVAPGEDAARGEDAAEPAVPVDAAREASIDAAVDADAGPRVGDPCTSDDECPGACLREAEYPSYPGGYCTVRGCNTADAASCPSGSRCAGGGGIGSFACFADCSEAKPCRTGYRCYVPTVEDASVCWRN